MRITGGQYKGRKLESPKDRAIRPTSDKVRQAIFNMILHGTWRMEWGFDLHEARVLDLFCGTGTLSFEAISHGAVFAYLIDKEDKALDIARKNANALGLNAKTSLMRKDASQLPPKPDNLEPFQLVFLDPPYNQDLIRPSLEAMHNGGWLSQAALCVVEKEREPNFIVPAPYQDIKTAHYGHTDVMLLGYDPEMQGS
tara:strand:+ start:101 stop:691 length:591 start_codon:yes stop_codon:yes gene_type:complete